MNISESGKKAIFVFGMGLGIFYLLNGKLFKRRKKTATDDMSDSVGFINEPSKREKVLTPKMNPSDAKKNRKSKEALIGLKAFINAYNSKEPKEKLEELNRELMKDMGITVKRRSDGKFCVYDSTGKEIMSNG